MGRKLAAPIAEENPPQKIPFTRDGIVRGWVKVHPRPVISLEACSPPTLEFPIGKSYWCVFETPCYSTTNGQGSSL